MGKVKASDHPDYIGGIVWTPCELSFINTMIGQVEVERDILTQRIKELEVGLDTKVNEDIDKIMAMSDEQISALNRIEGRNPKDVATIGTMVFRLAEANVKNGKLTAEYEALKTELAVQNKMMRSIPTWIGGEWADKVRDLPDRSSTANEIETGKVTP